MVRLRLDGLVARLLLVVLLLLLRLGLTGAVTKESAEWLVSRKMLNAAVYGLAPWYTSKAVMMLYSVHAGSG